MRTLIRSLGTVPEVTVRLLRPCRGTAEYDPGHPMPLIACATHWYTAALFLAPLALIGGALWFSGRREDRRRSMTARAVDLEERSTAARIGPADPAKPS